MFTRFQPSLYFTGSAERPRKPANKSLD